MTSFNENNDLIAPIEENTDDPQEPQERFMIEELSQLMDDSTSLDSDEVLQNISPTSGDDKPFQNFVYDFSGKQTTDLDHTLIEENEIHVVMQVRETFGWGQCECLKTEKKHTITSAEDNCEDSDDTVVVDPCWMPCEDEDDYFDEICNQPSTSGLQRQASTSGHQEYPKNYNDSDDTSSDDDDNRTNHFRYRGETSKERRKRKQEEGDLLLAQKLFDELNPKIKRRNLRKDY